MGLFVWMLRRRRKTAFASLIASGWTVAHPEAIETVTHPTEVMVAGRMHLAAVPYVLPKDGQEDDRLNFQHYVLYHVLGSHVVAPIGEQPGSILDVGTGTGKWAMDMARLFPQAAVIGFDVKLPSNAVPSPGNCTFQEGNILHGFPFSDNTFSYVHQRLLVGALPERQWPAVVKELVRIMKDGGYVELVEGGDTYIHAGPALSQFLLWGRQASRTVGLNASCMNQRYLEHLLIAAGLHRVTGRTIQIPLGWDGRTGDLLAKDTFAAFQNLQGFFCSTLGLSAKQFQTTVAALPGEWCQYHTLYEFYIAHGQRPH